MKSILNATDIMKIIPHRFPFLLVDGVTKLETGQLIEGFKNYTMNEWFFQGHVPNNPVVPGVLITESLAQLSLMLFYKIGDENEDQEPKMGYIGKIKEMQFKHAVKPGDSLKLIARLDMELNHVCQIRVEALCEEVIVAKGIIVIAR